MMKTTLVRIILILAIAGVVGVIDGATRGLKMPPKVDTSAVPTVRNVPPKAEETPAPTQEPAPEAEPTEATEENGFTAEIMNQLIESGSALVIDARSEEEFAAGHIPSAMNLPIEYFGGREIDIVQFLLDAQQADPELQIIVYCSGGDCHASQLVGRKLLEYQVQNVFIFEGGFPAWQAAGYPIE